MTSLGMCFGEMRFCELAATFSESSASWRERYWLSRWLAVHSRSLGASDVRTEAVRDIENRVAGH